MKFFPQNKSKRTIVITSAILFLFLTPLVYAATSADFQTKAQKYITNNCSKKNLPNDTSLFCYLYYKAQEHDNILGTQQTQLNNLQTQTINNTTNIEELQSRITALENNQSPQPTDFVFFNNEPLSTAGANSSIFDAKDYSKISFSYHCIDQQAGINLMVSADQTNWLVQYHADENVCGSGGSVSLSTAGRYYMVSMDSTTRHSLSVYAIGHFLN